MELFRRLLHGTKDVLEGYKIFSIEIKDEAFLSKGEDKYQKTLILSNNKLDKTEGTVFEISEEELLLADKYEPGNYKRIQVALRSGKQVWIYIVI